MPRSSVALLRPRLFVDPLQHVVDERAEQFLVLLREAEHPSDHVDRDVLRVLDRSIDDGLTGGDLAHLVEQLLAEALDLGFPRLDHLRREGRQEETTGDVVEWRIAGDRRGATDRSRQRPIAGSSDTDHDRAAREVVGVVRDLGDGVVGQRDPHAAVAVGVGDGATAFAQLLPHLGCGRVVRRIGVVEVGAVVGDRSVIVRVVGHPLPDIGALRAAADDELDGLAAALEGEDLVAGGLVDPHERLARTGTGCKGVGHDQPFSVIVMAYSGQLAAARRALSCNSSGTSPSTSNMAWP